MHDEEGIIDDDASFDAGSVEAVIEALSKFKRDKCDDAPGKQCAAFMPVPGAAGWKMTLRYRQYNLNFKQDCYFLAPNGNKLRSIPDVRRWFESRGAFRAFAKAAEAPGGAYKTGVTSAVTKKFQPRKQWVQCDSCEKWRSLPSGMNVPTSSTWFCDYLVASCDVPEDSTGASDIPWEINGDELAEHLQEHVT